MNNVFIVWSCRRVSLCVQRCLTFTRLCWNEAESRACLGYQQLWGISCYAPKTKRYTFLWWSHWRFYLAFSSHDVWIFQMFKMIIYSDVYWSGVLISSRVQSSYSSLLFTKYTPNQINSVASRPCQRLKWRPCSWINIAHPTEGQWGLEF